MRAVYPKLDRLRPTDDERTEISKKISWILRHGAKKADGCGQGLMLQALTPNDCNSGLNNYQSHFEVHLRYHIL